MVRERASVSLALTLRACCMLPPPKFIQAHPTSPPPFALLPSPFDTHFLASHAACNNSVWFLIRALQGVVVEQLFDEINVAHEHTAAAVAVEV